MARRTFDLPAVIGLPQLRHVGRPLRETSASTDLDRGGRDRLGHPVHQLLDLNDEDSQA